MFSITQAMLYCGDILFDQMFTLAAIILSYTVAPLNLTLNAREIDPMTCGHGQGYHFLGRQA